MRHSSFPTRAPSLLVAATLLFAGLTVQLRADDAPAAGTVVGTVTTANGKPAAKVVIYFFGSATQSKSGSAESLGVTAPGGRSGELLPEPTLLGRPVVKGKVTTDAKGKYTTKPLKAGTYSYRAGNPARGMSG